MQENDKKIEEENLQKNNETEDKEIGEKEKPNANTISISKKTKLFFEKIQIKHRKRIERTLIKTKNDIEKKTEKILFNFMIMYGLIAFIIIFLFILLGIQLSNMSKIDTMSKQIYYIKNVTNQDTEIGILKAKIQENAVKINEIDLEETTDTFNKPTNTTPGKKNDNDSKSSLNKEKEETEKKMIIIDGKN